MKTAFAALALTALMMGCSKPQPPQLTPKEATVTDVSLAGFGMRVKMDALNPNAFAISVRTVTAHVIVDGNQDLGTVTSTAPVALPANAHTLVDVPLNVQWKNVGTVAALAQARKAVPYTLDGTATIGGESLNVDVPFKLAGTISPQELQAATAKSIQNAIQGLQGLPGLPVVPAPVAH